MIFTIDNDSNIVAHDVAPAPQQGVLAFANEKELAKAVAGWPVSRLVETWNSFAGVAPFNDLKPVKKFENRTIAISRIWNAIQKLASQPAPGVLETYGPDGAQAEVAAPGVIAAATKNKARKAKAAKPAKAAGEPKAPREGTAKAKVIAMLERNGGATLQEIQDATGWQAHSVRGFLSSLAKKTGLKINSTRRESDKARVYEVER